MRGWGIGFPGNDGELRLDDSLRKLLYLFGGLFALYVASVLLLGTFTFLASVTSDSMKPALFRGDFVVIQKLSDYAVGDILVFRAGKQVFVHRAVLAQDSGFRTKGDANPFDDGRVVRGPDIYGKVVFRIPWLGHAALWLSGE